GVTMIAESGPARIIEVNVDGKLLKEIALKVDHPHVHRDTRLARKIDNGNYLVCHEADGTVREYDSTGKVVWTFEVPLFNRERKGGHGVEGFGNQCFSVLRLKNGNTLIGSGNGHSILEVTPEKKVVWSIHQNDLAGIQLAWVTSLQVLPGGNILIGNCHAGPGNPQIIEVTRDKKVVWKFHDFERFGNALTNSQVLFD
ncbi:MAG: PQQ-binding-like beta-propeller repeat protein, partial [Planctomycetota bacterium]|nr:PQQ-binding-like beta-propeller repeat protein [Planctomycetota bacterium]